MTLILLIGLFPSLLTSNIFAGNLIVANQNQFAPRPDLIVQSVWSNYSYTSSSDVTFWTEGSKIYCDNMSQNSWFTFQWEKVGKYQGRDVGCKLTFKNPRQIPGISTPMCVAVVDVNRFNQGYWYYNIEYVTTEYEFFYTDTHEIINVQNSYLTFASLNDGEYVISLNNSNGTVVPNSTIIKQTQNVYGTTKDVFWGTTDNQNIWEDELGGKYFEKSGVSISLSGTKSSFVVGESYRRYHDLAISGVWNAPSTYFVNLTQPVTPTKTVNNATAINANIGDTITYKISQKTHIMGEDTLQKYISFEFLDTLPSQVDYVSCRMLNGSGTEVSAGTASYNSQTRQLSYQFSSTYLQNTMAYNGETYTLEITCRINSSAVGGQSFNNTGTIKFNNMPVTTNTVTVTPQYKITTEVINGTITPSIFNIHGGSNETISYSPNPGYMIQSVTVDGVAQSITSFPDYYTFSNISADHHIKVVYEPIPNKTITITKIWNDRNNEYNTRPSSLKINVLQNSSVFSNVVMTSSNAIATDSNKWTITTTVPERDQYRNILTYTIEEDTTNINLRYFYETPIYDQSKLTVTNTAQFIPTTSNEHPEYKIIIHKDIVDKDNNIADSEDFEQVALDINDTYNFAITLKELNRIVTNTGTSLVESYNGYSGKVFNGIVTNKGDLVFNLGDEGYGKYEISENLNQYFDFIDIEKLNDEFNTSGASFSKENGKYYITLSGITGEFEQISVKVTNQIKPDRPYNKTEDKENLFKI